MTTFLLKTEPDDYSYADLERDGHAVWSGVTNNLALIHIRSARRGDRALVYHTGVEKAIVGLAEITSAPYEDPENPGTTPKGEPKRAVFDIKPRQRAATPLTLAQIKADPRFAPFDLVRQPRLSVMPVPPPLDRILRELSGLRPG